MSDCWMLANMTPRPELVEFCLEKAISVMSSVKGARERREAKECIDSVKAFISDKSEANRWRCIKAATTIENSSLRADDSVYDDQEYDHDHIPYEYNQEDYGWHLDIKYYTSQPMYWAACVAADIDLKSSYAVDRANDINERVSEINEMRQNVKILSKIKRGRK